MTQSVRSDIDIKRDFLLAVPEHIPVEDKKRRYAAEPDITFLKEQQKECFDKLWEFVQGPGKKMFRVRGVAGTGKTTTINTFIESLLVRLRTKRVAMTAPTNKAVKVLKRTAQYTHTNLEYMTIHRLLGLKEQIDDNGRQIFVRDSSEPCKLENFQYLVIDESSMLSDELFDMLLPFLDDGLKIVFLGDPCQIPPVGGHESIPMDDAKCEALSIETFDLAEIVRQTSGSPIIETTFDIRTNIRNDISISNRQTAITDNGAVVFLRGDEESRILEEMLKKYFTSENFKEDSDFVKIIAWRNKVVDFFNGRVRGFIFGDNTAKIEIGEKLIADKPIISGSEILFNTNDEMEVLSYEIKTETINQGQYNLDYYLAKVRSLDTAKPDSEISIIHENSDKVYRDVCTLLADYAKMQPKKTVNSKKAWGEYYKFMGRFASVKYAYAVTSHRSQGSTYNTTIVCEGDINNNSKVYERNRIKYTACSRPSRLLVII